MHKLTDEIIEKHKLPNGYHKHNDCIRIAYEWLSAQKRLKSRVCRHYPIKHLVERWAGTYVSKDDVQAAAKILGIPGEYPFFHISSRMTEPSKIRLDKIERAFSDNQGHNHDGNSYSRHE